MRHLVLAAILLSLQFVSSVLGEEVIIVNAENDAFYLEGSQPDGELRNCSLVTNTGKSYSVYPNNESPWTYAGYRSCRMFLSKQDVDVAGLWNLTTITDNDNFTDEFRVLIQTDAPMRPSRVIDSTPGQWIKLGLDSNDTDVRFCNVSAPHRSKVNLMTEKIEGASLEGHCGLRLVANASFNGEWGIFEQVGEYRLNHGTFIIRVDNEHSDEIPKTDEIKNLWDIGAKKTIQIVDERIIFCQITSPDGTKMPVTFNKCEHKITSVNAHHAGTWRASYARRGQIELDHRDIVIETKDPDSIECSYSSGTNGEINILCKRGQPFLEFCTFVRPDNHLLHLPVGVGNDNYSYYGIGYTKYSPGRKYAECGVTIHKPTAVDFGTWTCEMGVSGNIRGSMINVAQTRAGEYSRTYIIDQPPVFVKRNDSFKIDCKADVKLKYCWLTSPNGTAYSVSVNSDSDNTLKYEGKGLEVGECGATVIGTDSGDWICHLGIDGGFEIEGKVSVTVTDTYLVANNDMVYIADTTNLTCRTIVGDRDSINYCRWVRPNGHGINEKDAHRYKLRQGIAECGLTIEAPQLADVGKWTCVASLSGKSGQEEWANIHVLPTAKYELRTVVSFSLGTGFIITMLFIAAWVSLFFYRRKSARVIKNPPPYYPQDYVISETIDTNAQPIPNKNYKY